MNTSIVMHPIGKVHRNEQVVWIDLEPEFIDGLLGIDRFSHIMVLFWFDQNDSPQRRRVLQVHPMKDTAKPLTGVFATHSPMRPNLIGVTVCRLLEVKGTCLVIEGMDALDGTPVLDIKCHVPRGASDNDVMVPGWMDTGHR